MPNFIGVDLAWQSDKNHTGAVVLSGDRSGAELDVVAKPIHRLDDVCVFIEQHIRATTVVAVDAPLVIPNSTGQRLCETEVGSRYGKRDASCHTSNQNLYPNALSVELSDWLGRLGFVHAPDAKQGTPRVMLEVYPHASMVALFDLPKIIKYKKGSLAIKRSGQESLVGLLRRLSHATPSLRTTPSLNELLARETSRLKGSELKLHEDVLDAVFCAYVAYYFWYWGLERNEIFGNTRAGYIVNPKLLIGGIGEPAS